MPNYKQSIWKQVKQVKKLLIICFLIQQKFYWQQVFGHKYKHKYTVQVQVLEVQVKYKYFSRKYKYLQVALLSQRGRVMLRICQ